MNNENGRLFVGRILKQLQEDDAKAERGRVEQDYYGSEEKNWK